MARPSRIMAGSWKHSDFPPPVGRMASTSSPARAEEIISSCLGLKVVYPQYFFNISFTLAKIMNILAKYLHTCG